jgi:2-polyprenyl-6-methoxyphenol hydroxylase-like FAD-dependent oxidoreductase
VAVSSARVFAQISRAEVPTTRDVLMRQAVVLGGSIAGLLAARVLSDHAEHVLVIERDGSGRGAGPRPGVPQGAQVHALLPAGAAQLERWFPGFTEDAIAAGAVVPPGDGSRDQFYLNGDLRVTPPLEYDMPTLSSTRPFLEALVRRRILGLANVTFVTGRADGLIFDGDRVAGVRYLSGEAAPMAEAADLVVDATGRVSRLTDWLAAEDWPRPPMRRIPIRLHYASAMFGYDEQITDQWAVSAQTSPDAATGGRARIGGFLRVEDDRWIMLIAGYGDDRPSHDPDDYIARSRKDFPEVFGDIAERGAMLGGVATYHQADSRRRDFHELKRFPAGWSRPAMPWRRSIPSTARA